jgi:hypothetical protein
LEVVMGNLKVSVKMKVEGQNLNVPVAHALVRAMVVVGVPESAQRGRKTRAREQSLAAFHEARTDAHGEVILSLEPGRTYEITATGLGGYASGTIPIERPGISSAWKRKSPPERKPSSPSRSTCIPGG